MSILDDLQGANAQIAKHEEKEAKLHSLIIQYRLAADRISTDTQLYHTMMDAAKNVEDILNGND